MALSPQRASPSLAWPDPPPRWKFDVFLSFRGEDTRRGFTSHLYNQLGFGQVLKTFIDDQELQIGAEISPKLLTAIRNSHLAIVVLSPNYASSTWCLDELATIIDSMEAGDERILPVFYNVDPSDVRHQRKSFAEAFDKHEEKFSGNPEKVVRWREALRKVANLSGWDAKNYKSESELIEVIVRRVWEKVSPTITSSDSGEKLVGIDFRFGQLGSLLALEEKQVRFIGIWGMGGVGKTTLAKLVFERISHQFEVAEFLVDVRKSHGQLVTLQKQVLFPVMKGNVSQVWDEYKGTAFIRKCMSNKKVLLVVDDVDSSELLKYLAGHTFWFGEGSRIIVTTRDKRLLTEHHIDLSFELQGLNASEALELFSHKAFEKDQPEEGFLELSRSFVYYAKGLPLALIALGSSLYLRNLDEWKSTLDSLKRIPNPTIFDSLKVSYNALNDWQQRIFMDIAFFFKWMEKGRIIELLRYWYEADFLIVVNVLIEKSLLTEYNNVIGMHDLIQEMAEDIERQKTREPHDEPGLRSRLCDRDDIFHVFTRNTGTEAIRGIRLRLPKLEVEDSSWNWNCLSKMCKLMFLEFDNLIISSGPKFLPDSLIILRWNWYPSKTLPASFRPNLLVELKMQNSKLVRLWDGRQDLPNLKHMDLSDSKNLEKTPDFTGIPNLEELYLDYCEGLVEVHPSIAVNKKLKRLTLYHCINVKRFPSKIEMDSLEMLSLEDCSKVKILEFGEGMKNLSRLWIGGTAAEELPASIEHLVGLTSLNVGNGKSLKSLPGTALFKLKALEELIMFGCPKLKTLVQNTGETECLKRSMSKKLRMGFRDLFRRSTSQPLCSALPSPRALPFLCNLNLSDCNLCQGVIPDDIGYCLPNLVQLCLGGNNFVTLPASIKCLSKLQFIRLTGCQRLQELPILPPNEILHVDADNCSSLERLSEGSTCTNNLEYFEFSLTTVNCHGLIDKEGLNTGILSMLRRLPPAQVVAQQFINSGEYFKIVSPGSKISEWFDIQSEGDSLTVKLPPDGEACRSQWIGIVFCVVFPVRKDADKLVHNDSLIECSLPGLGDRHNIDSEHQLLMSGKVHNMMMGDHLWVSFMPRAQVQDTTSYSIRGVEPDYCMSKI
ncbi:TMV resistance protein N-like [Argentina anserina]|uniref:TMV resistance protein N-like n=1 Tax=Argentina anserina TaxID=57926 RepID=UPI0021768C22|nr:TMV resistance protein N-like [Potentilla anserina]